LKWAWIKAPDRTGVGRLESDEGRIIAAWQPPVAESLFQPPLLQKCLFALEGFWPKLKRQAFAVIWTPPQRLQHLFNRRLRDTAQSH
jgi:hypothetical protein